MQRYFALLIAAHRPGKPQPFSAIVIAVLKQMLEHRHPQPCLQLARGQQQQGNCTGDTQKAKLQPARHITPDIGQPLGDTDHGDHVTAN